MAPQDLEDENAAYLAVTCVVLFAGLEWYLLSQMGAHMIVIIPTVVATLIFLFLKWTRYENDKIRKEEEEARAAQATKDGTTKDSAPAPEGKKDS